MSWATPGLEELFVEVLRLCHEAGLVKLGVVALDGTKVAANAALGTNRPGAWQDLQVGQKVVFTVRHQDQGPHALDLEPDSETN